MNGKLQESASEQRRATRNAKTTTTGYRHDAEGAETRGIAWWCYYIPPSLMLYLWPTVVVVETADLISFVTVNALACRRRRLDDTGVEGDKLAPTVRRSPAEPNGE